MIATAVTFDTAVLSDPGSHQVNQDRAGVRVHETAGVWVVADGLGSRFRSEVSAQLAVDASLDGFSENPAAAADPVRLEAIGLAAQGRVLAGQAELHLPGIRTTLALLSTDGACVRWLHVGDTRVYHWSDGVIQSRTADHSVPQLLVHAGNIEASEIRGHPDRARLLAALGQDADLKIAISQDVEARQGDAFLICTDGWWESVSDEEMSEDLASCETSADWVRRMANRIARKRLKTQDHYTAVGVRFL